MDWIEVVEHGSGRNSVIDRARVTFSLIFPFARTGPRPLSEAMGISDDAEVVEQLLSDSLISDETMWLGLCDEALLQVKQSVKRFRAACKKIPGYEELDVEPMYIPNFALLPFLFSSAAQTAAEFLRHVESYEHQEVRDLDAYKRLLIGELEVRRAAPEIMLRLATFRAYMYVFFNFLTDCLPATSVMKRQASSILSLGKTRLRLADTKPIVELG